MKFTREDILCETNRIRRALDQILNRKMDLSNADQMFLFFQDVEKIREDLYDLEYKIMGKEPPDRVRTVGTLLVKIPEK